MVDLKVNEDIVRLAYQLILGRNPESDAAVNAHLNLATLARLRSHIMNSPEFKGVLLNQHAEEFASAIIIGLTSRKPEQAVLQSYTKKLKSFKDINLMIKELLKDKFVVDEILNPNTTISAPSAPVVNSLTTWGDKGNFAVFLEGFNGMEKDFVWSKQNSSILFKGQFSLYLWCSYLKPPTESREITVSSESEIFKVKLDSHFEYHELKLSSDKPKLIHFCADDYVIPSEVSSSKDGRMLSFQVSPQKPNLKNIISTNIRPHQNSLSIMCVASEKKAIDSLLPIQDKLNTLGYSTIMLTAEDAIQHVKQNPAQMAVFLISLWDDYASLTNAGCNGLFIYTEHGVSPIKRYTYGKHYKYYDLILLPGDIWTNRISTLYPETKDRCRTVGYSKLQVARKLTPEARNSLCERFGLDPARPIALFAPSWSGGDRECGIFNLRFFGTNTNLLTIPHDGDAPLAKEFSDLGYKVHRPTAGESISEYYHLADILISDISSTAIEFSAIGKPVLCISLSRIPDFDHQFMQADGTLRIPYTDYYWNFCPVVDRENVSSTLGEMLESTIVDSVTSKHNATISAMVACVGNEAAERSASEIIAFIKQHPASLFKLKSH